MGAGRRDNTVVLGRMARALLLFTGFLGKKWISTGGTGEDRALQAEERPFYEVMNCVLDGESDHGLSRNLGEKAARDHELHMGVGPFTLRSTAYSSAARLSS